MTWVCGWLCMDRAAGSCFGYWTVKVETNSGVRAREDGCWWSRLMQENGAAGWKRTIDDGGCAWKWFFGLAVRNGGGALAIPGRTWVVVRL
uniref:Uncharacterized protein n=1 Tax=Cannabis sativa TaxID=3483 RepID=A0A803QGT0_CANSA